MVGHITGKMFDLLIEKDCVSDLSGPASCRIGPVRQVAGPESAAIKNLAVLQRCWLWFCHPPYILLSRLAMMRIFSAKENLTSHFFSLVRSKIETFQKCGPEFLCLWDVFYLSISGLSHIND